MDETDTVDVAGFGFRTTGVTPESGEDGEDGGADEVGAGELAVTAGIVAATGAADAVVADGVVEVGGAATGVEEAAGADETVGGFTLVATEGTGGVEGVKDLAGTDDWPATDAATGADEAGEETGTEGDVVILTSLASASVFGDGLGVSVPSLATGASAL